MASEAILEVMSWTWNTTEEIEYLKLWILRVISVKKKWIGKKWMIIGSVCKGYGKGKNLYIML